MPKVIAEVFWSSWKFWNMNCWKWHQNYSLMVKKTYRRKMDLKNIRWALKATGGLFFCFFTFMEFIFPITLIILIVWLDNWVWLQFFTVLISVCWEVFKAGQLHLKSTIIKDSLEGAKSGVGRSSPQVRSPRRSSIVAEKHWTHQIGRGTFGWSWIEERLYGRGPEQIFFSELRGQSQNSAFFYSEICS